METRLVTVEGRATRVHEGGAGEPLLLLHGGWAGAEIHWGPVWHALARGHRVIAPELPGVTEGPEVASVAEYGRWTLALMDALELRRPWIVGNSLGATIGWEVACEAPPRVRGLVLVDGGSFPRDPLTRFLLRVPGGLRLLERMARFNICSPGTLRRCFADPSRAPAEIVRILMHPDPPQFHAMMRLFVAGSPGGLRAPAVPTLVVWGAQDRLIGMDARAGARLARRIPGARFEVIEGAGHLPQLEQPDAFVELVAGFVARAAAPEHAGARARAS